MTKQRIIDLQKQVTIARRALEQISTGHCGKLGPEAVAERALDEMRAKGVPAPLAGLLGWEKRPC